MENSTSKKIYVGIFIIVGTILLITALYSVGKRQNLFSKNIQLFAIFTDVSGLQVGNNVRYSGVDVGTVKNIQMTAEGKITVEMSVEQEASRFIKKNAVANIASDGLVGSMVVNIIPGDNKMNEVVVTGDHIQIKTKITIDEILETFSKTNESAVLITADLAKITHKIVEGEGFLGAILSDSLMENDMRSSISGMKRTVDDVSRAMAKVNSVISKIDYDESAVAVLLSDPKSRLQIQNVFSNLEKSSEDINKISQNVDDYINEIKSGKGSLNYITKDEKLVQNIDSTMINVKEASEKLNENMEALKHNFLFRGYFKKIQRKKDKELKKSEVKP
ncbi:MlaD family protein [Chryseobacterium chendengshani]|uniref:MlaD family protein n=1 Tax=Chryseobacterium sp. LJ668 TaxID=2864040 RepID=UPI001C691AA7|nr:MlaD family protein [Chryseobacterium sp. LJ668]MBW8523769.1 MlaD family protein [Chryseobacterium sp. LJ668]QYK16713.1 MlaD family protein [Chryseobacterium sp. LJ668]